MSARSNTSRSKGGLRGDRRDPLAILNRVPVDLLCTILEFLTKPEAYLALVHAELAESDVEYATRVRNITPHDIAEAWTQIGATARLQTMLDDPAMQSEVSARLSGSIDKDKLLCAAARHGQLGALELLRNRGAHNYGQAFAVAASTGQTTAMKTLLVWSRARGNSAPLEERVFLFDLALWDAASHGHLETMRLLKECGATEWDFAMKLAASHGQCTAMQELYDWGANSPLAINLALSAAASGAQIDSMKLAKRLGATDNDEALSWAAFYGRISIMHLLKDGAEWGFQSPIDACNHALRIVVGESEEPSLEVIELLRSWGANDWDAALSSAAFKGRISLMHLCRQWGATVLDDAFFSAVEGGQVEAAELLLQWKQQTRESDAKAQDHNNARADLLNDGLCEAAKHGRTMMPNEPDRMRMIEWLLEQGATHQACEQALVSAAVAGNMDAVRVLVSAGAHNYTEALEAAREERQRLQQYKQRTQGISDVIGALVWLANQH